MMYGMIGDIVIRVLRIAILTSALVIVLRFGLSDEQNPYSHGKRKQTCENCYHLIAKNGVLSWKRRYDCRLKSREFNIKPKICSWWVPNEEKK